MSSLTAAARTPGATRFSRRQDGRVFGLLLALYWLILYPILRANRYHEDDLKRALIGRTGWDSNGRPLTTLLMKLLQCYDHALADISPFTQIAAIAILAWIGVLVARRYAIRSPWLAALIAFPLGAQPFFLANLSYKFDSLSMSLALLLALLPVLVISNHRRGWWLGVLSLFGGLIFYQPALNAYVIFVLLELLLAQLGHQAVRVWLRQLLLRISQLGATLVVYQIVVGMHISGWVEVRSRKIHSLSELPLLKANIVHFYQLIGQSFNRQWWTYFLPLLLMLTVLAWVIGLRYSWEHRGEHKTGTTVALVAGSLLLPLVAIFSVAGPMLLLLDPVLDARVLVGVGALLVAALVAMQAALARWRRSPRWVLAAGCMLGVGMCAMASAYGNALGEQKQYEDRVAAELADSVANLEQTQGIEHFMLDGTIGYAPITAHVADEFPLIRLIINPYLSSSYLFATRPFLKYYIKDLEGKLDQKTAEPDATSLHARAEILAKLCQATPVYATSAYRIRVIDGIAVVSFPFKSADACLAPPAIAARYVPPMAID